MSTNQVRREVRNRSAADVGERKRRIAITLIPSPASGCQGLSRRGRSTPGDCSSKGRSFAALIFRRMVGRSTPRCSYSRQGYAPAPQRAPRLRSARTPLRGAKLSPTSTAVRERREPQLIHLVPAAFSGMCCRNSVARFLAFCFRSPNSYDAMDFVDPAFRQLPSHRRDHQIGRARTARAEGGEEAQDTAVPVDARIAGVIGTRTGPRGRGLRRHTASVRLARHAIAGRRQARLVERSPSSSARGITGMFRAAALKTARSFPASRQDLSRMPQLYRTFAHFDFNQNP